ncbi:MAG: hypothetical protein HUJ85_05305 [Veillonella sp.]|nr:hypothetical protein [Veillonella sp.]
MNSRTATPDLITQESTTIFSIEDVTDQELKAELEKGLNCHYQGLVYNLEEFKTLVPEVQD